MLESDTKTVAFFLIIMKFKKKIILASSSPRRYNLLNQVGIDFEVIPSSIEEIIDPQKTPEENVAYLSELKALDVSKNVDNAFIVGADTIVVLNGKILGKPKDEKNAFDMLKLLSNKEHKVYTGFTILDKPTNKKVSDYELTVVKFRELEDEEIWTYISTKSPIDKAGAYGIQDDFGALFVERINGCFYNVVGFPLTKFYLTLKKFQEEI